MELNRGVVVATGGGVHQIVVPTDKPVRVYVNGVLMRPATDYEPVPSPSGINTTIRFGVPGGHEVKVGDSITVEYYDKPSAWRPKPGDYIWHDTLGAVRPYPERIPAQVLGKQIALAPGDVWVRNLENGAEFLTHDWYCSPMHPLEALALQAACDHVWKEVHHLDDDGKHYCPTGFERCALCFESRKKESPECQFWGELPK